MVVEPIGADESPAAELARGEHFSCSLSAVLLARVHEFGGDAAVATLLRDSGSRRSREYLADIGNWIAYEEAVALLRTGAAVTHHPDIAHAIGVDSGWRLSASPVAALLRSLGAPENVYREITATAVKYSTVTTLHAGVCEPGHAELEARQVPGFPRSVDDCRYTIGLLSVVPTLFGLAPATVAHEVCAAHGASVCHYRLSWPVDGAVGADDALLVSALREQLEATRDRLHGVFRTASDLIGSDDVEQVLARIAERAATEVRAPRHLLAVRLAADGPLHVQSRGFSPPAAGAAAERLLAADLGDPHALPRSWLAVPVASDRREYGRILAAFPAPGFLPQERELLQVYARFAASALDGAGALDRAMRREHQSHALLELAHALSAGGTQSEIARRLVDSLHIVVDCDRVAVYLQHEDGLIGDAVSDVHDPAAVAIAARRFAEVSAGPIVSGLIKDPRPEPVFVDLAHPDATLTAGMRMLGLEVMILLPLISAGELLGLLFVSVLERPDRLRLTDDLLRRLSGVAAQAGTALQNGRLLDFITYQALHDDLTGLANRSQFTAALEDAVGQAHVSGELAAVFYLDLDGFKPVNDELGHQAGDELLAAVADRLRTCVRANDLVARLGGDEFGLLVVTPTDRELDAVGARLAREFAVPFEVAGHTRSLSLSVGRAVFPGDARDPEDLVRRADAAMFAHKRSSLR